MMTTSVTFLFQLFLLLLRSTCSVAARAGSAAGAVEEAMTPRAANGRGLGGAILNKKIKKIRLIESISTMYASETQRQ